jgi:hypothetical protein
MRKRSEAKTEASELVAEMEPVPEESSDEDVRHPIVENQHAAHETPIAPGFARIVERIFIADPEAAYARLESDLRIGDERATYGALTKALDEAETNARTAHRLYISAKVERERWELDNEVAFGAMRAEATRSLQREKDTKARSKQITDADVASECAMLFPDEYRAQALTRKKVKAMEDSLANLSEVWLIRCKSLQTMLGRQR